ncbi:MAG: hypothetical protein ACPGRX_08340 [Bdellovibrionales bacterium]
MLAVIFCVFAKDVRADVFVWQDPVSGASLSFPDTWTVVHNQAADDVVSIAAPGITDAQDHAMCRMRVRDDRRFGLYPVRYSDNLQRLYISGAFWEDYALTYDNPTVEVVQNNKGLGRGFASYAELAYDSVRGPRLPKKAMALASLYNGRVYIVECSAEAVAFAGYRRDFLGIMKSVDFRKSVYGAPHAPYRNFLNDRNTRIYGERLIDSYDF